MAVAQLETQNLLAHARLTSHKTNYREDLAVARGLLPSSCTEIAERLAVRVADDEASATDQGGGKRRANGME
jgi:hypothetical protein